MSRDAHNSDSALLLRAARIVGLLLLAMLGYLTAEMVAAKLLMFGGMILGVVGAFVFAVVMVRRKLR